VLALLREAPANLEGVPALLREVLINLEEPAVLLDEDFVVFRVVAGPGGCQ
jgi:hypothetical protein